MKHYVLCQHGLLGNAADFQRLADHFNSRNDQPVRVIILEKSSGLTQTLDGVEEGGSRCLNEILSLIWSETISRGSRISFVGHSLGGLYFRFALREIESHYTKIWDDFSLERIACIFLATPHVGIDCSGWIVRNSVKHLFRHFSSTARDLNLTSNVLTQISDEKGLESLNHFKSVILYGNAQCDNLVSLSSSLILTSDSVPLVDTPTSDTVVITELTSHETTTHDSSNARSDIIECLNKGLKHVRKFAVWFPQKLPNSLRFMDNTAHHRIVCHGILDRGKEGLPVVHHLEAVLERLDK